MGVAYKYFKVNTIYNKIKLDIIPIELALSLKKLKFHYKVKYYYNNNLSLVYYNGNYWKPFHVNNDNIVALPFIDTVIEWFVRRRGYSIEHGKNGLFYLFAYFLDDIKIFDNKISIIKEMIKNESIL